MNFKDFLKNNQLSELDINDILSSIDDNSNYSSIIELTISKINNVKYHQQSSFEQLIQLITKSTNSLTELSIVENILANSKININSIIYDDNHTHNLLTLAAEYNNHKVISLLIKYGIDLNYQNLIFNPTFDERLVELTEGNTAIREAIYQKNDQIINQLLTAGANLALLPTKPYFDNELSNQDNLILLAMINSSNLLKAIANNQEQFIKLADRQNLIISYLTKHNNTETISQLLSTYQIDLNCTNIVKPLTNFSFLEYNFNLDKGDLFGDYDSERYSFAKFVSSGDQKKSTPLIIAAENSYYDIVQLLLNHQANINQKAAKAFAQIDWQEKDNQIYDTQKIVYLENQGNRAIDLAKNDKIIKLLVQRGANVNSISPLIGHSQPNLLEFMIYGSSKMADFVIANGIDTEPKLRIKTIDQQITRDFNNLINGKIDLSNLTVNRVDDQELLRFKQLTDELKHYTTKRSIIELIKDKIIGNDIETKLIKNIKNTSRNILIKQVIAHYSNNASIGEKLIGELANQLTNEIVDANFDLVAQNIQFDQSVIDKINHSKNLLNKYCQTRTLYLAIKDKVIDLFSPGKSFESQLKNDLLVTINQEIKFGLSKHYEQAKIIEQKNTQIYNKILQEDHLPLTSLLEVKQVKKDLDLKVFSQKKQATDLISRS